jgi:hypothetical protein
MLASSLDTPRQTLQGASAPGARISSGAVPIKSRPATRRYLSMQTAPDAIENAIAKSADFERHKNMINIQFPRLYLPSCR